MSFRDRPARRTKLTRSSEQVKAHLSFVLTSTEVVHVHLHGGEAVLSPKVLLRCVAAGRSLYQQYVARVCE